MHTHTIDLTTDTHICLLCDEAAQPHSRFCNSCATTPNDVPTCPCGVELSGLGSYCSSACAEIHGRNRRATEPSLALAEAVELADALPLDLIEADDLDLIVTKSSSKTPAQKLKETLASDIAAAAKSASISTPAAPAAPRKNRKKICTFCTNSTKGVCRCKRPLCGPCADDETGLCPHCADDAE